MCCPHWCMFAQVPVDHGDLCRSRFLAKNAGLGQTGMQTVNQSLLRFASTNHLNTRSIANGFYRQSGFRMVHLRTGSCLTSCLTGSNKPFPPSKRLVLHNFGQNLLGNLQSWESQAAMNKPAWYGHVWPMQILRRFYAAQRMLTLPVLRRSLQNSANIVAWKGAGNGASCASAHERNHLRCSLTWRTVTRLLQT